MIRPFARRAALIALCVSAPGAAALAAPAALGIEHPWSRPTPPAARTAVGYLTVVNRGSRPDRLDAVSSPVADKVEIHSMSMAGGVMRMRPVEGGLPVPAGGSLVLGPEGDHLMFIGLKRSFQARDSIPVVLVFQHAGPVRAQLRVEAPQDAKAGMAMPGMDMSRH